MWLFREAQRLGVEPENDRKPRERKSGREARWRKDLYPTSCNAAGFFMSVLSEYSLAALMKFTKMG
jgi:hypothetical protein